MKEINQLSGAEFIRKTYECAETYAKFIKQTGVADILSRKPTYTGNETAAERERMAIAQHRKNTYDFYKALFYDGAEATAEVLPAFVVLEDGETPSTSEMLSAMCNALGDKLFMDFFQSLAPLVQLDTTD